MVAPKNPDFSLSIVQNHDGAAIVKTYFQTAKKSIFFAPRLQRVICRCGRQKIAWQMKMLIRKLLQQVGYDIVKYHRAYVVGRFDEENLEGEYGWMQRFKFKTILDIGANEGQFADKMQRLFPLSQIYSFEPIPETFQRLQKNFSGSTNIHCMNLAVGDAAGQLHFNKNESTASSSFLELSQTHVVNFDFAARTEPITVQVDTLDNIMKDKRCDLPMLVKIDVQGYEDRVLQGGAETISAASVVLCEVSFTELYKGQPLFHDIYQSFSRLGFTYAGSIEQLRSPEDNRILQADAIFLRTPEGEISKSSI